MGSWKTLSPQSTKTEKEDDSQKDSDCRGREKVDEKSRGRNRLQEKQRPLFLLLLLTFPGTLVIKSNKSNRIAIIIVLDLLIEE